MEAAVLIFQQEIFQIGLFFDFVRKKNINVFFIVGRQYFVSLLGVMHIIILLIIGVL